MIELLLIVCVLAAVALPLATWRRFQRYLPWVERSWTALGCAVWCFAGLWALGLSIVGSVLAGPMISHGMSPFSLGFVAMPICAIALPCARAWRGWRPARAADAAARPPSGAAITLAHAACFPFAMILPWPLVGFSALVELALTRRGAAQPAR